LLAGTGVGAREFKFQGEHPIQVVATVGMVADAVRNVGGGLVQVEALMASGVDPHLFKPSQGDVRALDSADMVFYSGLHLEGKMVEILEKIGRSKPSIALAQRLPEDLLIRVGEEGGELAVDPHVWFDASLWALVVEAAGGALAEFDPPHASEYQGRASKYREEILELHDWAKERIAEIPKEQRVLITAHDAFHYFGRAYEIEVMGLQGVSTAAEFGLNDVNRLVDTIVGRGIKALFVESSIPRRSIEAVQEGCQARGHKVIIGGTLFSDAMGEEGTPEGTYPGMFRHNVNAIVGALK
ncbi:MAG: zinc ABC transporter substrate-binding protein, partial [Candidatus Omnitrophica bacterium]|nr:zinc ABC transporter substrate-binding protein [Candidatus Omnitrophota bacterium]